MESVQSYKLDTYENICEEATISRNQSYFQTNTLALQFIKILKANSCKHINSHIDTNSNIPIAANFDIGTTVFSDIGARYVVALPAIRKMQEMYKRIIENSKQHVHAIRSNAIIGL